MSISIMVLGGPKRDGKCHNAHAGYDCMREAGHGGEHADWRLGVGTINWDVVK